MTDDEVNALLYAGPDQQLYEECECEGLGQLITVDWEYEHAGAVLCATVPAYSCTKCATVWLTPHAVPLVAEHTRRHVAGLL